MGKKIRREKLIISLQSKTDFVSFFQELSKPEYDPISREDERELLYRYQEFSDDSALQSLIQKNLRYVVSFATKMLSKKEIIDDLDVFNAGVLGLVTAINKFKLDLQRKLITYAAFWIRHEVQKYKREQKIVCLTHYITFNIQKAKDAKISLENEGYGCSMENAVCISGLTERRYKSAEKAQQIRCLIADTEQVGRLEDLEQREDDMEPIDFAIQSENTELIRNAVEVLPEEEADVIKRRYFCTSRFVPSYRAIAKELNCSHEQVRKLEMRGLHKLRIILGNQASLN